MQHKFVFRVFGVIAALAMPPLALAGEGAFPDLIPAMTGSPPEGFAIGRKHTAYNGALDGSIYKMDLRTGEGHVLVPPLTTVINDLAIARDAVYLTDSFLPFLYKLPLSRAGHIPLDPGAAVAIPLTGDFVNQPDPFCCQSNGIVAMPNGKALVIGHSNRSELYLVNPATGHTQLIDVNPPLEGFLDGIVMHDGLLYIMTPTFGPPVPEKVQVVALSDDLLSGELLGFITNPYMDGVASGGMFGGRLYVNNARYFEFPTPGTEYWITEVDITDVQ